MWTPAQLARLNQEYSRIGGIPGQSWPVPRRAMQPEEYLAFLRRVPSSSGLVGYMKLLEEEEGPRRPGPPS